MLKIYKTKIPRPERDGGPCYHPISPMNHFIGLIMYAGLCLDTLSL